MIPRLPSPSSERIRIRSLAAELIGPRPVSRPAGVIGKLFSLPTSSQATAFDYAFDALSFVVLGLESNNQSLVSEGVASYRRAVSQLRKDLAAAVAQNRYTDELLAAPYLLVLAENFAPLSRIGTMRASAMHIEGFARMVIARGGLTSESQLVLLDDYHHHAMQWCRTQRRAMNCPIRKKDVEAMSKIPDRFPRLTELLTEIPALLEKFDAVMQLGDDENKKSEVDALIYRIASSERKLHEWQTKWYKDLHRDPFIEISSTSLLLFDANLDLATMDVFPTVLSFFSFGEALSHLRLWTAQLVFCSLQRTLVAVLAVRNKNILLRNTQRGTMLADSICKGVVFLCGDRENGLTGWMAARAFLATPERWYAERFETKKTAWCLAMKQVMRSKGLNC